MADTVVVETSQSSFKQTVIIVLLVISILAVIVTLVVLFHYVSKLETIRADVTALQTFRTENEAKITSIIHDETNDWVGLTFPTGDVVRFKRPASDSDSRTIEMTHDFVGPTNEYKDVSVQCKFSGSSPFTFVPIADTDTRIVNLDGTTV